MDNSKADLSKPGIGSQQSEVRDDSLAQNTPPQDNSSGVLPTKTRKLLLVDDDLVDRKRIRRIFNSIETDFEVHEATSRSEALDCFEQHQYDCILLDFRLGGDVNGLELLAELKSFSKGRFIPVVLVTGMGDERLVIQAFKSGVQDYIVKSADMSTEKLLQAIEHSIHTVDIEREKEASLAKMEYKLLHDPLTDLGNRKLFFTQLEKAMRVTQRNNSRLALLLIDLDQFKQINHALSRPIGDQVLVTVSKRLKRYFNACETLARVDGDVFVVTVDVATPEVDPFNIAQELIEIIQQPMAIDNHDIVIKSSIGISFFPDSGHCLRDLVNEAEMAMYRAKKSNLGVALFERDKSSKKTVISPVHIRDLL